MGATVNEIQLLQGFNFLLQSCLHNVLLMYKNWQKQFTFICNMDMPLGQVQQLHSNFVTHELTVGVPEVLLIYLLDQHRCISD